MHQWYVDAEHRSAGAVVREGLVPKFQSSLLKYLPPRQQVPDFFPTFLVTSAKVRIPHVHTKPNRSDQRGAASLCYRNLAEITVLMCEQKPYPFDFRAASSLFVRKISTKKRVTNEKTTKRFIEIYPKTRCSVNLMRQPIISRQCTSEKDTFYKPYRYCCCFFFPWSNICGEVQLSKRCVIYMFTFGIWLLYISNLGSRGTFATHILQLFKPLPLVALITSLFLLFQYFSIQLVVFVLSCLLFFPNLEHKRFLCGGKQ